MGEHGVSFSEYTSYSPKPGTGRGKQEGWRQEKEEKLQLNLHISLTLGQIKQNPEPHNSLPPHSSKASNTDLIIYLKDKQSIGFFYNNLNLYFSKNLGKTIWKIFYFLLQQKEELWTYSIRGKKS